MNRRQQCGLEAMGKRWLARLHLPPHIQAATAPPRCGVMVLGGFRPQVPQCSAQLHQVAMVLPRRGKSPDNHKAYIGTQAHTNSYPARLDEKNSTHEGRQPAPGEPENAAQDNIAFRLQSIFGQTRRLTTACKLNLSHNRLSASVHIWTKPKEVRNERKTKNRHNRLSASVHIWTPLASRVQRSGFAA